MGIGGQNLNTWVQRMAKFYAFLNPIRTGGGVGGVVFHHAGSFLPITLEVMKVHNRNFVTLPKILCQIR